MSITRVAKLAGVSSSTVSRVVNNHPRVSPETAEAVRSAMKTLNWTPSDRRPGPKPRPRGTPATVAFLVLGGSRERATPAFEDLLRGVSLAAQQNDVHLIFSHVPSPDDLLQRELTPGIDALLLHGAMPGPQIRDRLKRLPTVWLMGNRRKPDWGDQVMPDRYAVGEIAARYLIDRGHRELAFLNLDRDHWHLRLSGFSFAETAEEAGARVHTIDLPRDANASYWEGYAPKAIEPLVDRFLALKPRPTGLFVADDLQVAIIQPALQRRGVEIGPGQVEIIACNNEKPYLVGLDPQPAEIDIRVDSIGRRGVEQLLWRLRHPNTPERVVTTVEPALVVPDRSRQ